ncbi:hypothetical protein HZF05_16360 [Sphingomonas sp. CGMCC 1.13654]|uniref:Uncharacterized protein n=1 Tax=Sphingomonas chungangi TaxID=2683589 RepID=A0A838LDT9_9SPHN|nr:hypothetical protein [Sphingomonas chungangi]MBA2935658.1 hypothetical protein [Sphingomonas chungangi]MVW54349.1 hypothetical protein [Sphingomonas chungangi]
MIERPWGHWLLLTDAGTFEDAHGQTFRSVRECFWRTQLRMGGRPDAMETMLEQLLAVLLAIAPGLRRGEELDIDLFDGCRGYRDWYMHWLVVEKLAEDADDGTYPTWRLTALGLAAMRMLAISRPHAITGNTIGRDAIAVLRDMERVVGPASSRMAAIGEMAADMDTAFVRDTRRPDHCIVLVRRDHEGDLLLTRTIWSVSLPTVEACDALYLWLCDHLDRWGVWSNMAWRHGGARLSQHLIALMALDVTAPKVEAENS